MLSALEMCHNTGIAHRDIKPENILLDGHFQLKMADFGLSSIMEVSLLSDYLWCPARPSTLRMFGFGCHEWNL